MTISALVFAKSIIALGRYTHRFAIPNSYLVGSDEDQVTFTWTDYRHGGQIKVMTLLADIHPPLPPAHVPDTFHRIHHLDFLANRHRTEKLALCPVLLAATAAPDEPSPPRSWQDRLRELTGTAIDVCPCCAGQIQPSGILPRRPPPHLPMWCDSS